MSDVLKYPDFQLLSKDKQDEKLRQLCTEALNPGPWYHSLQMVWSDPPVNKCPRCKSTELGEIEEDGYAIHYAYKKYRSKERTCLVPPEASGSWADLSDLLWRKSLDLMVVSVIFLLTESTRKYDDSDYVFAFRTFNDWSGRERVICLLISLGKMKLYETQ